MLSYNEITAKKVIVLNGEPFEVLSAHVFRKQQRKPVNQTKLRGLKTGKVVEQTFHQNESAEEADLETRPIRYLYARGGEYWFCEENDPSKRFSLPEALVGTPGKFLKTKELVTALVFEDEIIGVTVPIKMDLKVTEAAPAVRGNTAQGATKQVTLEGGATIAVPLFINEGDIIRVNTETGAYVERMEKK